MKKFFKSIKNFFTVEPLDPKWMVGISYSSKWCLMDTQYTSVRAQSKRKAIDLAIKKLDLNHRDVHIFGVSCYKIHNPPVFGWY